MSEPTARKRLAQLRKAYEGGVLDADTYRAAVAALTAGSHADLAGAGAIAQGAQARAGFNGGAMPITPSQPVANCQRPLALKHQGCHPPTLQSG